METAGTMFAGEFVIAVSRVILSSCFSCRWCRHRTPSAASVASFISLLTLSIQTVSALSTIILGVVTNPEVLIRAQKELDEVLGRSRLPEFSDEASLPYITAIVMEGLRWHPVLPMGTCIVTLSNMLTLTLALAVPHLVTTEDTYKGYRIPAGSIVIANVWCVLASSMPSSACNVTQIGRSCMMKKTIRTRSVSDQNASSRMAN